MKLKLDNSEDLLSSVNNLRLSVKQGYHEILGTPVDLDKLKEQLKQGELELPDDAIQYSMRLILERNFLNSTDFQRVLPQQRPFPNQGWIRVTRLPVSPIEEKKYALYPRWQNTIATLHALELKLCYVLLRADGETQLLIGAIPVDRQNRTDESIVNDARERLNLAVYNQMPGIGTEFVQTNNIPSALLNFGACGAVTGIPSTRKITEYGEYQTMDQIAMGLRVSSETDEFTDEEKDFAVVICADPVSDEQIVDVLRTLENIGSEIHTLTQHSKTEGTSSGSSISVTNSDGTSSNIHGSVSVGSSISAGITGIVNASVNKSLSVGGGIGHFTSTSHSGSTNIGQSDSLSLQYLNKSAQYCEELVDKHIARLKAGRNLGFWKTGVYVLAEDNTTVRTVMGMLRAMYSGDDTYVEPIRTTLMPYNSGAAELVKTFRHIPYPYPEIASILGELYQDYATPITTEELSIATSLPRQDVPGIRLVRTASRFAANPPVIRTEDAEHKDTEHIIELGKMMNSGVSTGQMYRLDLNQLVKHTLIAGINGSGKSNTSKYILNEVIRSGVPVLVVEPSKDEYIRWALDKNRTLSDDQKIEIFAPGLTSFNGVPLSQLQLNPFQPAALPDAPLNMLGHLDRFKSALLGSLPMADVLPLIMEETIYAYVRQKMDVTKWSLSNPPTGKVLETMFRNDSSIEYPILEEMKSTARDILEGRQYANDVRGNLSAAMDTRINALLQGWKQSLFNQSRSTDFGRLFDSRSVVVNLSHLPDDRDKALVMSQLLIALWEYKESQYNVDETYRKKADLNQLMHLTLIEEAHRLLKNTSSSGNDMQGSQAVVSQMFSNMMSEIRAYGEGLMIAEQVPTRLIPDAVKNTNLKIIHRLTSSDDIHSIATGLSLRKDQESVVSTLQPGEAIICGAYDDAAAWVKVHELKK